MSLSIGIVGLPNVGKSTLFNALTRKEVPSENYPFCTIDPSVGIVEVPDERLRKLSAFSSSVKTIPAIVEFVDIAGLVEGASKGEGLGNKFLANIREVDAILHLVRVFELKDETSTEQIHVYGDINPLRDIQVINMELILADMETVQGRISKIEREVKRGDKKAIFEMDIFKKLISTFEQEKLASSLSFTKEEGEVVYGLHLLTMKPVIYGFNKKYGGENLHEREEFKKVLDYISENNADYVIFDAKVEHELSEFVDEEKDIMKMELKHEDDGINELIRKCYSLLNLITFLTTGEDETRAWTVKRDSTAPIAGRAIHNDFYDKFIRADIINWQELLDSGSFAEARSKGKLRTEGKEYIVKDGDVIEFRI